jgi:hypothetical protein
MLWRKRLESFVKLMSKNSIYGLSRIKTTSLEYRVIGFSLELQ